MKKTEENPRVHITSLGCAKNLVDTEVMCGKLVTEGFYLVEEPVDADIMLINTCGFIRDAKQEAIEALEDAVAWKGRRRRKFIVAAGCLVQREGAALREAFPQIDLFLGLDDVPLAAAKMKEMLAQEDRGGLQVPDPDRLPLYLYDEKTPRLTLTPPTYAYVKVAEGCDHRCAYCAIPHIRGNQRSRSVESVLAECRQLLQQGVYELNLIAQDTSRYGTDLSQKSSLEELLRRCDSELEEAAGGRNFWIRVLYTHPLHITEGLLDILAQGKHVVPYLDIPLQHIATNVLKRMGRGMDGPHTRQLLQEVREKYPQMIIRTTFLVGFPGETEEDFQELLSFVEEFGFDRMGAFAFSPEEGTPAAGMDQTVPERLAQQRRAKLLAAQQRVSLQRNRALIGKELPALLEEQAGSQWQGRTIGDAPEVDPILTVRQPKGQRRGEAGFSIVKITGAEAYRLMGTEVAESGKEKK